MPKGNPDPSHSTRFRPGYDPRRQNGRKPGTKVVRYKPVSEKLRDLLADEKTVLKLARSLLNQAIAGDARAFRELLDRVEGKVPLKVQAEPAACIQLRWSDDRETEADDDNDPGADSNGHVKE